MVTDFIRKGLILATALHESQANATKNSIGDDEDEEGGGEGRGEDGKAGDH